MDDSDAGALVKAALQNDDEAARALVRRLYPLVAKIVRAHRSRRTPEEDLCQMIFIKVFQKLSQFSGNVPLEHWVSRVAVNTCLNQIESEKVRPKKSDEERTDRSVAAICGAEGRRGSSGDAVWIRYSRGRALARWYAKGERRDAAPSTRGRVVDSRNRHFNNRGNSRNKSEPRNPRIVRE